VDSYFMVLMMDMAVVQHPHSQSALILIINPDGVFTLKIYNYGLFSNRK
jgi:gentisate 1,2-dioxygenase